MKDQVGILKILLVEDDEDDFYFFNEVMSSLKAPCEILQTSNGIMFLSLIQTSIAPDIIFLDINVPYKNGIACLKEIRSRADLNSLPVVIYSTSANTRDVDDCYKYGANFYIVKPASRSIAVEQLKVLFENEYFKKNQRAPREEFLIRVREESSFHTLVAA